jgi:hypothetical protein
VQQVKYYLGISYFFCTGIRGGETSPFLMGLINKKPIKYLTTGQIYYKMKGLIRLANFFCEIAPLQKC